MDRSAAGTSEAGVAQATGSGLRFYRPYLPLFLGLFFCHFGIGATLSVLPFYVRGRIGGGDVDVGTVIAAIAVAVVLTRPVAGRLSDRIGHKVLMLAGALLCALAGAAYALAASVPALIAVRALHGIGEGAVFTAGATWLVALAPAERRGKIVGLYGVSMWTGVTLGALAGATLLKALDFGPVWAICTVVPLVGTLFIASKAAPAHAAPAKKSALFPAAAIAPGIALALASMGYAALASFVSLHMAKKGIDNGILAFNVFGFAYVGSRLFLGHWPDKLGPYRVAFGSALVEALGLALVGMAPNLAVAVMGGLGVGLGLSLLYPSLALAVIRATDPSHHGAALGMFTSFWDLGVAAGGIAAGFVASRLGYPMIYAAMLASALASAGLVLALGPRSASHNKRI
ncbi:MFS transporter [Trinickia terrae]|uniref:MFS transporter n=1 Tax=Trinickia terrae TaxID=2571161 RepID=A0A4U1I9X3_9BURK|nr:MFS transporter [Trinickia terrae]TKC90306.1 MFS transporter [Trinickia terrae]